MLRLGEIQELKCVSKVEFGVYLAPESDEDEKVLLPIKQVPEGFGPGDSLEVFVYKDSKDRIICTVNEPLITVGKPEILTVADTGKFGAFVDCGLERDILLPFKEQTHKVKKGDKILVAMYVDKSGRLAATEHIYEYLQTDSPYHAGDEVEVFPLCGDAVMRLQPVDDGADVGVGGKSVAQHLVFAAFTDGIEDEVGCLEVHIGHPHRQEVVGAEELLEHIVFYTVGAAAGNDFVEIIHRHSFRIIS